MTVQPFERAPDTSLSSRFPQLPMPYEGAGMPSYGGFSGNDTISSFFPPTPGALSGIGLIGAIGGLLGQLGQLLQQLTNTSGFGGSGGNAGGNEQFFQTANGASTGDPHLSFNGNTWNSMTSRPDLLHSDSFPGGFQISTQVTQPNQAGVTYNQQATITTNYGGTSVSLDNAGNATIMQNGQQAALTDGTTLDLGNGDTVTRNQDGSLVFAAYTANGGSISTTLRDNGSGVDVNVSASGVDLGGDLIGGPPQQRAHVERDVTR